MAMHTTAFIQALYRSIFEALCVCYKSIENMVAQELNLVEGEREGKVKLKRDGERL